MVERQSALFDNCRAAINNCRAAKYDSRNQCREAFVAQPRMYVTKVNHEPQFVCETYVACIVTCESWHLHTLLEGAHKRCDQCGLQSLWQGRGVRVCRQDHQGMGRCYWQLHTHPGGAHCQGHECGFKLGRPNLDVGVLGQDHQVGVESPRHS
ncbi:hypothetical protein HaLaN_08214 [Haematococcus lacustris]|uniref:Uncharacterized protein n=1 Tax=Haematococcus lacustris TaxID=44745 RepID=A0A699YRN5_HAELA|nr:hypothetical protein HaLaN_08214 [Haematococcus lacustris]